MKKLLSFIVSFALFAVTLTGFAACGKKDEGTAIKVWCSEVAGVKELTEQQIRDFNNSQDKFKFKATVEPVSESKAAGDMISSVRTGADLFFFAQDQFARAVQAGALTVLRSAAAQEKVKTENLQFTVDAVTTSDDLIYAYPLTSDNTFFMYYDKSVVQESSIDNIEAIMADLNNASPKRKLTFNLSEEGCAWYLTSFFFATGCKSEWTINNKGVFTAVDDDFNSDKGKIAVRGLQKVIKNECYNNNPNGAADFGAATKSGVVISGTWDLNEAKDKLGDNLGIAKLPQFTVDETSYRLIPYVGSKLLGVRPTTDPELAADLRELAVYLSGEKCQLERYQKFGWRPSNKNLIENNDDIKADKLLDVVAYNNQSGHGVTQGQIPDDWWAACDSVAVSAKAKPQDSETDIAAILSAYASAINKIITG